MKNKTRLILLLLGLAPATMTAAFSWHFVQTCVQCLELPMCFDTCGNEPRTNPQHTNMFCGSTDYVEGCIRKTRTHYWCENCPNDPVTQGDLYQTQRLAGWVCTNDDCF